MSALLILISNSSWAADQKVLVKINSCDDVKIRLIKGSECEENDYLTGHCKNADDCICISSDKSIKWRVVSSIGNQFRLKFKDETGNPIKTPFKNKCLDDFKGDKVVCQLKTKTNLKRPFYDFLVKVKGCENAHDPRIVIRNFGQG